VEIAAWLASTEHFQRDPSSNFEIYNHYINAKTNQFSNHVAFSSIKLLLKLNKNQFCLTILLFQLLIISFFSFLSANSIR
jgi:hypothetical protein